MMKPDCKPYLVILLFVLNMIVMAPDSLGFINFEREVYTWTDRVYITITAPDFNFDRYLIDHIGDKNNPIKISTGIGKLENYKLVESGANTGIFTGMVTLTGFADHDADGDGRDNDASGITAGTGPTDGTIAAENQDDISVSFEYSNDNTVIRSAPIGWNIGQISWSQESYSLTDQGVLRILDPDMNLNPESIDSFDIDVFSDSDIAGIDLVMTETAEKTGIFEGVVFFTDVGLSSGHRLHVDIGDMVTAQYNDHTLPDPYGISDDITMTTNITIGDTLPPLQRVGADNQRVVNAFGQSTSTVSIGQQVQIAADITNNQDTDQPFVYIVDIQDDRGVTVSLSWFEATLAPRQSLSPSQSWTPISSGSYYATIFVWESIRDPTALSQPLDLTINVS